MEFQDAGFQSSKAGSFYHILKIVAVVSQYVTCLEGWGKQGHAPRETLLLQQLLSYGSEMYSVTRLR